MTPTTTAEVHKNITDGIQRMAEQEFKEPQYITEARIFVVSVNKAQVSLYRVGRSLLKSFSGGELSTRKLEALYKKLGIPISHMNISRALILARSYKTEEDLLRRNFQNITEAVKAAGEPEGRITEEQQYVLNTRHLISAYISTANHLLDAKNLPVDEDRVRQLWAATEKFREWLEGYMKKKRKKK